MNRNNVRTPREPWLAVTLSKFLAGVGQIYSGSIRRGCMLIFIAIVLFCSSMWFLFSPKGSIKIGVGLVISGIVFGIWNLFDAHKCARRVNTEDFEISRKESKDPWLAVFLSYLLPGLGQLYAKKWFWGVAFIISLVPLLILKKACPLFFFGLWAILSSYACYHAYISSPVHRETPRQLIVIIAMVILCLRLIGYIEVPFKRYFVEAFKISRSDSAMEPILLPGDRILVRKSVMYPPIRGDIVVFKSPMNPNIPWVKRIVALEGESIEIKNKSIYINGNKFEFLPLQNIEYVSIGNFGVEGKPFVVPHNSIFVLGDNSSNSMDSRFYGSIPQADLVGKAYKIYWPPKRVRPLE